jgi:prevent-host-death family protein
MINLAEDIESLSRFKRNTVDLVERMRRTGRPIVLTVNGKAELVVQHVESYQRLLDLADRMETLDAIEAGLQDVDTGRVVPAGQVLKKLSAKAARAQRATTGR